MELGKCKQALAKVINANGGWVDDADCATQDKDGWVCSYEGKPTRCGDSWKDNGDCLYKYGFDGGEKIQNWHQCVLSREEYYQAYPEVTKQDAIGLDEAINLIEGCDKPKDDADAAGWIEWNADGKSDGPIGYYALVDVRLRSGSEHFGQLLSSDSWMDLWGDESIVAYRLHKPEVKPELCESVMRSIPEPEEKPTIEQLAQDYRNKLDFANRKQQEADDAKAASDAALGELELAGEAIGLLIGIAKPEPELEITDRRDLQVGDLVSWKIVSHRGEFKIISVHHDETREIGDFEIEDESGVAFRCYGNEVTFIRRP